MNPEEASSNEREVIARSRSRYKGNRQNSDHVYMQTPPQGRQGKLQGRVPDVSTPDNGKEAAEHAMGHGILTDSASEPAVPRSNVVNEREPPLSRKQATVLPDLKAECGSEWTIGGQSSPNSGGQLHSRQRKIIESTAAERRMEADEPSVLRIEQRFQDFESRIVNERLSLEFKAPRELQAHRPYDGLQRMGSEARSSHDHTSRQHVHSAQTPSEHVNNKDRASSKDTQAKKDRAASKPSTLQKRNMMHKHRGADIKEELKRTISAPMPVEPPEYSTKPAFDAPVSAVNAGERRVRIYFDEHVLSVPVLPSTTPQDIFRESSSQLSIPIDAKANVLLESFKQLGLERPLRDYEHVRDVLNSWDRDSQNALNIVPSPVDDVVTNLDMKSIPQLQPGDTSVHIYHSNSPGLWDKRWVTLRSDGQVVMLKKDGKANSNICHISDFDIYSPTKRQMAKKIKPPTKYCFAVKSQQKSAMFLSTENFVHFFAASDRELATVWYKAVQEWRSWYLVNVMGAGQKDSSASERLRRPSNGHPDSWKHGKGGDSLNRVSQPSDSSPRTEQLSQPSSANRLPNRSHGPPPVAFPQQLTKGVATGKVTANSNTHLRGSIIQHQALADAKEEPFAAQSLLGRTYTHRQRATPSQTREKAQDSEPRIDLLGNGQRNEGDDLQQIPTHYLAQKPLLDLTRKYQEPPQHQKRGRGFIPEQSPAGGLVKGATNSEPALLRAPSAAAKPNLDQSRTDQSPQISSSQRQGQDSSGSPLRKKIGDRSARAPLLDAMTEEPWVKGSLLDRINHGDSTSSHALGGA